MFCINCGVREWLMPIKDMTSPMRRGLYLSQRLLGRKGLSAEYLLADKGYDSDAIVEQTTAQGMSVVIPPRKKQEETTKR